jgi:hypothetical protein
MRGAVVSVLSLEGVVVAASPPSLGRGELPLGAGDDE